MRMDVGRWWVGVSRWWVVIQVGTSVCVGGTEGGIAHTPRSLEEGKRKETEERDGKRARERGKRATTHPPQAHATTSFLLSNARDPNPIVNCPPPSRPRRRAYCSSPSQSVHPLPKASIRTQIDTYSPKCIRTDLKTYGPRAQKQHAPIVFLFAPAYHSHGYI